MAFNTYTNISINKRQIKPTREKDLNNCEDKYAYKGSRFIQILKISLANANYEDVINFVCNEEAIEKFKK